MKKLIAEGIGTMFLVLLACGSAVLAGPSIGGLGIGLCFGLVLVCLCYALGNISGCHVNPAVSFAMYLAGRMSGKDCIGYIIFQLLGATIGAGLLFWFINMAPGFNFGGTTPPASYLATNVLPPGAIGLALGLVNIVGIPVDNCSVNPARSFGPAVFDPTAWGDFWIMVVGPAIGAVLAVLCWVAMAGGRKAIK